MTFASFEPSHVPLFMFWYFREEQSPCLNTIPGGNSGMTPESAEASFSGHHLPSPPPAHFSDIFLHDNEASTTRNHRQSPPSSPSPSPQLHRKLISPPNQIVTPPSPPFLSPDPDHLHSSTPLSVSIFSVLLHHRVIFFFPFSSIPNRKSPLFCLHQQSKPPPESLLHYSSINLHQLSSRNPSPSNLKPPFNSPPPFIAVSSFQPPEASPDATPPIKLAGNLENQRRSHQTKLRPATRIHDP